MTEGNRTGAFEQAMLDALADPGRDIIFEYRSLSGVRWECPARHYLQVGEQEQGVLKRALGDLEPGPKILDLGCGVGRHLKFCRQHRPDAELWGVEEAPGFRAHCEHAVPGSRYLANINDLGPAEQFDAILLMGNGLGMFGDEEFTRRALAHLHGRLRMGGALLIESGQFPMDGAFRVEDIMIAYQGRLDGPFPWNFAPLEWLHSELESGSYRVLEVVPCAEFPGFHFTRAVRGH